MRIYAELQLQSLEAPLACLSGKLLRNLGPDKPQQETGAFFGSSGKPRRTHGSQLRLPLQGKRWEFPQKIGVKDEEHPLGCPRIGPAVADKDAASALWAADAHPRLGQTGRCAMIPLENKTLYLHTALRV